MSTAVVVGNSGMRGNLNIWCSLVCKKKYRHLQKQDKASVLHLALPPPFSKHFLWANMPSRTSVILERCCVLDGCSTERKRHEPRTVRFECPSLQRIYRKCRRIEQQMQERKKWNKIKIPIVTTATLGGLKKNSFVLMKWHFHTLMIYFSSRKANFINNLKIYMQTQLD